MQRLDHVAKLVQRAERVRPRAIAVVRREKRERLIPPIVPKPRGTILFVEGKNRQKLDGGDAEILEIGNLFDQPGIGAALRRGDARARMPGEAADMHLVDDRVRERPSQGRIVLPVVGGGINDDALQRRSDIVPRTTCGLPAAPRVPGDAFPVRVEQHLIRVETQSSRRIGRSSDPVGIDLARRDVGHKDIPIMVGPVGVWVEVDDAGRARRVRVVEQQ
jgi:hypothetical protein